VLSEVCRVRPLAVATAPLLIRFDLPRAIAEDGPAHTWRLFEGTLEHITIEHRTLPDLLGACHRTLLLHVSADGDAPVEYVRALAVGADAARVPIRLRVSEGDHHRAVRHPELVAAAAAELAVLPDGEATGG